MRNHVMPMQQQIRLREKRRDVSPNYNYRGSGMMWEMLLYILAPILFAFLGILTASTPELAGILFIIAILAGTPLVLIITYQQHFAISRDLSSKRIESVEGYIQMQIGRGNDYRLNVNGLSLTVDKESFTAFRNGDPYVIYYATNSKIVLGAEWIDGIGPDSEVITDREDLFSADDDSQRSARR